MATHSTNRNPSPTKMIMGVIWLFGVHSNSAHTVIVVSRHLTETAGSDDVMHNLNKSGDERASFALALTKIFT